MRATISFDVELDRVKETMQSLVQQEGEQLYEAIELLSEVRVKNLERDIEEVLVKMEATLYQLRQYRDMVVSFKNIQQSPVATSEEGPAQTPPMDMSRLAEQMANFDGFLERINSQNEEDPDEEG